MGARSSPARPEPMMTGATRTCSRSTQPASMKAASVRAPPSINMRRNPSANSASTMSRGAKRPSRRGEFYPLDARAGFGRRGADQNPPRAVLGQPFAGLVQPAAGVDRDAGRARPDDPPHVELGIVGGDGSGADHDSVDMGAQTMQMIERRRAADAARLAADGGDPSIERLADLRDDERAVLRGRAQRGEGIAGLVEPRRKIKVGRGARHLGSLFLFLARPGLC